MAETLDPRTKEILTRYLHEVRALPNESAKQQRFSALIGELFPGSHAISLYASGVEKLIRIKVATRVKRGRADAYYGNAIIEFEKSLKATLADAKRQLREYTSGIWPKPEEGPRNLLAIASDGLDWEIYRPVPVASAGKQPGPDEIELETLREFKLTEETLGDFWLWLTSFLFRPQRVEPSPEQFQVDFGVWSPLYREALLLLEKAWAKVSKDPEAVLAFETWQRYLTVTYGRLTESSARKDDKESGTSISELERFFLRHTYLSSIARLLIWAALSRGKTTHPLRDIARQVLNGEYFEAKKLANLVEDDFFHWLQRSEAEALLAPAWERILSHLLDYDLSRISRDVLKGVYQQLIDPKDRHDLGEYYTPDWLCERMVAELLPQTGFKAVLDPACGSGSFLRAAISHFLLHNTAGRNADRLREIVANVKGIDIHPVAVTIARATYVLALGGLIKAAKRPIQIPVYLADSLFLPTEVQPDLYNKSGSVVRFGPRKASQSVILPNTLIANPELFDECFSATTAVAEDQAKSGHETRETLKRHLHHAVADLGHQLEREQIIDALWEFAQKLAGLIKERKNSIWSFIIRNSYRPAMFWRQFDVIIGNPPWLSYRYIADPEYQDEIKRRAVQDYKIAPKSQKLFTQMELATVFLAHSMSTFARRGATLGFVMPRSVLSADQHQQLICRRYKATFRLTAYWDLWHVAPLFNVPATVLFARFDPQVRGFPSDALPVITWSGDLRKRDMPWTEAATQLHQKKGTGRVIYLGGRCALSTEKGETSPGKPSKYQKAFRQGATIVPRSFFFVRVPELNGEVGADSLYHAETDPEQARGAKPPYDEVHLSGNVEGAYLYSTAIAKNILPFVVLAPATVVLPVREEYGSLVMKSSEQLREDGDRGVAKWMDRAQAIWVEKRREKAARHTLIEWLDYQGKLTAQSLARRHLVLYNAAGTNVSAACFDRQTNPLPFIVEHKLYWAAFSAETEAHYVTAVLNSSIANKAIKPFQSTGLMGERDIEKKLLDLPIPEYNPRLAEHRELARLGRQATSEAAAAVTGAQFPAGAGLARQRGFVRVQVAETLAEIDKLVATILP